MPTVNLVCTRATGLGYPDVRWGSDYYNPGTQEHQYGYGYFGFDNTAGGVGYQIIGLHSLQVHVQSEHTRSDLVWEAWAYALSDGFADQSPTFPDVDRGHAALRFETNPTSDEVFGDYRFLANGVTADEVKKIIKNGLAIGVSTQNAVAGDDAKLLVSTNRSTWPAPVLSAEGVAVPIHAKNIKCSGGSRLTSGYSYDFSFETEYDDTDVVGSVQVSKSEIVFAESPIGGEVLGRVTPGVGNTGRFLVDLSVGQRLYVWVEITSNSGAKTTSEAVSFEIAAPSATVTDLRPNSKQFYGFPVTFSWRLSSSAPSGATGALVQTGVTIRWRAKGTQDWTSRVISGGASSAVIEGGAIPGGQVEYQIEVIYTGRGAVNVFNAISSTSTFENKVLTIRASDLYPAEGAVAPRHVDNRFGWTTVADNDDDFKGQLTVKSAVFRWREHGQTQVHEVQLGAVNAYTVPAGTFQTESIDWQVTITANTGAQASSEWITVSTVDALSKPAAVSPVGVYVTDSNGILFEWLHIIATGTPQTGWELSYSTDESSWNEIAAGDGAQDTYQSAYGLLPIGRVFWRVRTKNTDGVWGAWSASAAIAVERAPKKPEIVYTDNMPLPTIKWQAVDQAGYQITIGDYDTGPVASTAKSYTHTQLLPDGVYHVTVRIVTATGLESEPAEIDITVRNVPGEAPEVSAVEAEYSVYLTWQAIEGAVFFVLRDGVAVLRTTDTSAWDWLASGRHGYQVRAIVGGYYSDSVEIPAISRVPNGVIGPLDGSRWVSLDIRTAERPTHDESITGDVTLRHYYGRALPVDYTNGFVDRSSTQTWTLPAARREDYEALADMATERVVYKDCFGRRRIGVLTSLSGGLTEGVELSLGFAQVDYIEEVSYAGIG